MTFNQVVWGSNPQWFIKAIHSVKPLKCIEFTVLSEVLFIVGSRGLKHALTAVGNKSIPSENFEISDMVHCGKGPDIEDSIVYV